MYLNLFHFLFRFFRLLFQSIRCLWNYVCKISSKNKYWFNFAPLLVQRRSIIRQSSLASSYVLSFYILTRALTHAQVQNISVISQSIVVPSSTSTSSTKHFTFYFTPIYIYIFSRSARGKKLICILEMNKNRQQKKK